MGKRKGPKKVLDSHPVSTSTLDSEKQIKYVDDRKNVASQIQQGKATAEEDHEPTMAEGSDDVENSEHSLELNEPTALSPHMQDTSPMKERGPAIPPWLTSPVARMGRTIASMPQEFDLDASFSSTRSTSFDAPSVVTDLDDHMRNRERAYHDDDELSATSAEKNMIGEELSKVGISMFFETNDDEGSLGALSDLSTGNQSYILDLATQKENREKYLKEETFEEALILYKEARKAGHGSEAFFLMIVAEVQKKLQVSKEEFFKIQDKRLDQALDDELLRRQHELNSSAGSLPSGVRGKKGRVDDFIEREKCRKSLDSSQKEDMILAASEMVMEMNETDFDWEEGNKNDESAPVVVEAKTKVKSKTKAKAKKAKKKAKVKQEESNESKQKKKSKVLVEVSEAEQSRHMASKALEKKSKKEAKSKEVHEGVEAELESSKPINDIGQEISPSKKSKKKKRTDKTKKSKKAKKTSAKKEEDPSKTLSTHQSIEAKDDGDGISEKSSPVDDAANVTDNTQPGALLPHLDMTSTCSPVENRQGDPDSLPTSAEGFENSISETMSTTREKSTPKRRLQKSMSEMISPARKVSNLLSSVFHRKSDATGGKHPARKASFFRKNNTKEECDNPAERLLPEPGSQLQ